jgi:hypothetical protein
VAPPSDEDDMYSLAGEKAAAAPVATAPVAAAPAAVAAPAARPAPRRAPAAAAGVAMAAARALAAAPAGAVAAPAAKGGATSPIVGYGIKSRSSGEQAEHMDASQLTELFLPIGLIVFGFVASVAELAYFNDFPLSLKLAIPIIGLQLIVDFTLLAVGCLLAIKAIDVAFGAPGPAALKLVAIALAPDGAAAVAGYYIGDFASWAMALVMYYVLFHVLFDLDLVEILLLSGLTWVIRTWVGMVLIGIFVRLVLGGGLGSPTSSAIMVAVGGAGVSNADRDLTKVLDESPLAKEAREWFTDVNNLFGNIPNEDSRKLAEEAYAAGAERVTMIEQADWRSISNQMVITLPRGAGAKRKALFAWAQSRGYPNQVDTYQRYMVLPPIYIIDRRGYEPDPPLDGTEPGATTAPAAIDGRAPPEGAVGEDITDDEDADESDESLADDLE